MVTVGCAFTPFPPPSSPEMPELQFTVKKFEAHPTQAHLLICFASFPMFPSLTHGPGTRHQSHSFVFCLVFSGVPLTNGQICAAAQLYIHLVHPPGTWQQGCPSIVDRFQIPFLHNKNTGLLCQGTPFFFHFTSPNTLCKLSSILPVATTPHLYIPHSAVLNSCQSRFH